MSSQNYFDLLGDDENEEPTTVIARATMPLAAERPLPKKSLQAAVAPTHISSKPTPQFDVVKEQKTLEAGRGYRGVARHGRGSRSGVPRELRDGQSREHGHQGDRNFIVDRDSIEGLQGKRLGVSGVAEGPAVGLGRGSLGVGHGEKFPRVEGDNVAFNGNRGSGRTGRGGGRGRSGMVDMEERSRRRDFERRSGSGYGEVKKDGSGRGNWGAEADQGGQQEAFESVMKEDVEKKISDGELKIPENEHSAEGIGTVEDVFERKDNEDDNELTLDEYEKILEEKRKALSASKLEERKVLADKAFESMQLVEKKVDADVFIKLGADKEKKKKEKEALDKEEKVRKTQSINEFLKPADGEKSYGAMGVRTRGRGRARMSEARSKDGERHIVLGTGGNFKTGLSSTMVSAPRIEDPGQFPTLGAK